MTNEDKLVARLVKIFDAFCFEEASLEVFNNIVRKDLKNPKPNWSVNNVKIIGMDERVVFYGWDTVNNCLVDKNIGIKYMITIYTESYLKCSGLFSDMHKEKL